MSELENEGRGASPFLFAVKHKATERYLKQGSGSSHWDPAVKNMKGTIRFFPSRRNAYQFIASWARGKVRRYSEYGEVSQVEVEDVGRSRDVLVIVKWRVTEMGEVE